jgi:hypothetical protein
MHDATSSLSVEAVKVPAGPSSIADGAGRRSALIPIDPSTGTPGGGIGGSDGGAARHREPAWRSSWKGERMFDSRW